MSLTSVNKLENNTVELVVSEEQFQDALNKAYKKKVKSIALPGFRKGKAPKAMIEKMYGKEFFYDDAINMVYPSAYEAAVEEANIEPVDRANVSDLQVEQGKGFSFKATVTVKPEVTVKNYKGIKAEKTVETIMAADVNAELDRMRERNSRLTNVERAAKNGDTALINFEGFKEGVAFEGGKGENFPLVLGSGQFIPGFEEQVVGHAAGDEFDVNVTFPEDYHAEDLKGQPVVFKVKVNAVQEKELPALDDEFAKDVSEFDTLAELKKDVKERLQKEADNKAQVDMENSLISTVIENMEGFNAQVNRLINEREEYFEFFANAIFKDGKRPAGTDWVIEEFRKLPPWLSAAIYSDYIATDFTDVLPTITVPTLVVNADGPVFAWGIKQGTYLTTLIPNGKFVPFTESGHMLFYEEADKFNKTVSDFVKDCMVQKV